MLKQRFRDIFHGKRIAILGFGREGRSTFRRLRQYFPGQTVNICDRDAKASLTEDPDVRSSHVCWHLGPAYLEGIKMADIIIKSPGVPFSLIRNLPLRGRITSQSELFLELFRDQVCGITGTKGKSTTASLLYHILKTAKKPAVLAGNIGMPCFDVLDDIRPDTRIVFEMSSHQLQDIGQSPQIAVLLNIFQEHLDHYTSFQEYQQAKMNIVRWQSDGDYFIFNPDNPLLHSLVSGMNIPSHLVSLGSQFGHAARIYCAGNDMVFADGTRQVSLAGLCYDPVIPGRHNLQNIGAAVAVSLLLDVPEDMILKAVNSFRGLPHRLEFVGAFHGVNFYNDSIATIPEATMAAVNAFPDTATIILGGTDRGIDYKSLMDFLSGSSVEYFFFTGEAGRRMKLMADAMRDFKGKKLTLCSSFDEAVRLAVENTPPGRTCLLSPAAASYDAFKDFQERGTRFKDLVRKYGRGFS